MMNKCNLLGISGKAGSGKDLVGRVIQYLIYQNSNTEFKFEGSNSLLHKLLQTEAMIFTPKGYRNLIGMAKESGWQIKKFAYKVKQILSLLTGIPVEDFEKEEVKNSYLGEEWNRWCIDWYAQSPKDWADHNTTIHSSKEIALYKLGFPKASLRRNYDVEIYPHVLRLEKITVRQALQMIGTDLFRDKFHPQTWCNALFADYKESKPPKGDTFEYYHSECIDCKKPFSGYKRQFICNECYDTHNWYPNWIITDVRFSNEAQAILDRGGILIRVNRPCSQCDMLESHKLIPHDPPVSSHESETALDSYDKFHYIIDNSGTIEELIEKVKKILNEIKII